jgi:hypothetical protein
LLGLAQHDAFCGDAAGDQGVAHGLRAVLGQFGIDANKFLLISGHIVFGINGIDRTFRHTYRTIDALVGVNY